MLVLLRLLVLDSSKRKSTSTSKRGALTEMRNWEIKCRRGDLEGVRERARVMGARDAGVIEQEDTFFPAPGARLKLRDFGEGTGELIAYVRADAGEARGSDYRIYRTDDVPALREALTHGLGMAGQVRKRRHLFLWRYTRIHLDQVEGLGSFVELETVIADQPEADARDELESVARALGVDRMAPVPQAYVDLFNPPVER